jgi:pyruvate dehydrogenase E2 component (dihydrolipoamide acetyltransferase)
MTTDFKLPELGENVHGGDVLRVLVKPGDAVAADQPVLELETDKATIEVPSSVSGTVGEIKVKPGEKVKVGQTIFTVAAADGGAADGAAADGAAKPADTKAAASGSTASA